MNEIYRKRLNKMSVKTAAVIAGLVTFVVVILLSIVSLLAVYSSSGMLAFRKQGGNTEYYLYKQFFLLLFGFGLMYITHLIRYTYFSRISQIGLIFAIGLLIYTMLHAENINNSRRWDEIFGISYQSSDIVKLFPGSLAGPAYVKALKGPFPHIPIMPTGGVSAANVGEWFAAGVFGVGAGSELCPPALAKEGRFAEITQKANEFMQAVQNAQA